MNHLHARGTLLALHMPYLIQSFNLNIIPWSQLRNLDLTRIKLVSDGHKIKKGLSDPHPVPDGHVHISISWTKHPVDMSFGVLFRVVLNAKNYPEDYFVLNN